MITHQDIREKSFDNAKAVFGGYDMGAVEDYLDDVADAFEALQKENSALKTKMKILVDKTEEYRTNEDALNRSILSAQKLSVQIESDARSRAATIVSEAETKAASILGSIDERIATEENRLQQAKISAAKFLDQARTLCQDQLNKLDLIAASNTVAAAASDKDSVRIPQENNAPAADKSAFDAGNTQVFSFSKDN